MLWGHSFYVLYESTLWGLCQVRICVLSCDRYHALVPGCMFFIERYWGKERPWDIDIVSNVERPRLEVLPYNKVYVGTDWGLSSNLIAYLDQLQDNLFLLILEDYFLSESPNTEFIKKAVACMETHEEIGYINLRAWSDDKLGDGSVIKEWTEWNRSFSGDHERYGIKANGCPIGLGAYDLKTAKYLLSFQPGIWRGDFLKGLLRERESGWEAEIKGTERAREARKWMLASFEHWLPYCNIVRYGIWRENPDGSTSQDWIIKEVGTSHWIYKELSALLGGQGLS